MEIRNTASIFQTLSRPRIHIKRASAPSGRLGGGAGPVPVLTEGGNGYIYGVTREAGTYGYGTIYKLNLVTGQLTTLYNFGTDPNDGSFPGPDGMTLGTDGNFYGVTSGIQSGFGSIYELTGNENYIRISSLYGNPEKPPLQNTNGTFYGVTQEGGDNFTGSIYTLDIGAGPFIAFVRAQGHVGGTAQILGQRFTGTTSVTFNGIAAISFNVVNDTYLTAVVPSGATTGKVVVTTPSGTLTSNVSFRIIN